jgi:ribosomal protein L31E
MQRAVGAVSVVTLAVIAGAAGAATTLRSTWRSPDAAPGTFRGKKVVAVFVSQDEGERRSIEGLLASELTERGAQGVPAVVLVPAEEIRDESKVRARLEAADVAGAVVFRLVAADREITAPLATYYGNKTYASLWGGYWGVGWDGVYAPGILLTQESVHVEVLVYSLEQNKLVWAGQSSTTNPKRADKLVREIVTKVAKEMKKAGLITPVS